MPSLGLRTAVAYLSGSGCFNLASVFAWYVVLASVKVPLACSLRQAWWLELRFKYAPSHYRHSHLFHYVLDIDANPIVTDTPRSMPPSDGFLRWQIRVIAPFSHQRLRLTIHRRPTIKTTAARGFPLPTTSPDHPLLAVSLASVTYVSSLLFIVVESSILPCSTPLLSASPSATSRWLHSVSSLILLAPPFLLPSPSYPVLRAFTLLPFSAGIPLLLAIAPPASCSALPSAPASSFLCIIHLLRPPRPRLPSIAITRVSLYSSTFASTAIEQLYPPSLRLPLVSLGLLPQANLRYMTVPRLLRVLPDPATFHLGSRDHLLIPPPSFVSCRPPCLVALAVLPSIPPPSPPFFRALFEPFFTPAPLHSRILLAYPRCRLGFIPQHTRTEDNKGSGDGRVPAAANVPLDRGPIRHYADLRCDSSKIIKFTI
ncbi:hypothetical protein C8R46DRAFT_1262283 [Mycena filopes]|nr:hypothetical protein C8R46DRAFT_1262283 [Mycena filopes]